MAIVLELIPRNFYHFLFAVPVVIQINRQFTPLHILVNCNIIVVLVVEEWNINIYNNKWREGEEEAVAAEEPFNCHLQVQSTRILFN